MSNFTEAMGRLEEETLGKKAQEERNDQGTPSQRKLQGLIRELTWEIRARRSGGVDPNWAQRIKNSAQGAKRRGGERDVIELDRR